jgi:hypothetical protein
MKESPVNTSTSARELDHRVTDGIHVTLVWYPTTNRVAVVVFDQGSGESFELDVPAKPRRWTDSTTRTRISLLPPPMFRWSERPRLDG